MTVQCTYLKFSPSPSPLIPLPLSLSLSHLPLPLRSALPPPLPLPLPLPPPSLPSLSPATCVVSSSRALSGCISLANHRELKDLNLEGVRMILLDDGANPCESLSLPLSPSFLLPLSPSLFPSLSLPPSFSLSPLFIPPSHPPSNMHSLPSFISRVSSLQ